jgi:uncharacterized surface protein with fasciclin (FAS1) repeats
MTRFSKLTIIALTLGLLFSLNASAGWGYKQYNSCTRTEFIDVRGNTDIDSQFGDGDGRVTIAEVAIANPLGNLDTLLFAVTNADPAVLDAIADPEAMLTVFAPDNDAFAAIPSDVLNGIISSEASSGTLTSVLLCHVVAGYFDPLNVWYVRSTESLLGQELFVKRVRTNPSINQSEIGCAGVQTDNGLVWLIDSVLLPQF